MKKIKITAFLNAYTQGKSGADVIFVEIYKRIKNVNLTVVTSQLGKKFCEENGLHAEFIITTKEKKFTNVIYTYISRIYFGYTLTRNIKADVVYSTSDALPDVLPAFLLSKKLNVQLIGNIFHSIPQSRIISHLTQKISFQLYKWSSAVCVVDSELVIKELVKKGFKKNKLILRYPGINTSFIEKIKPIKKYDVTTMLRIHPSKGIYDLVEIWKDVTAIFPELTLGIIGTGEKKYINDFKNKIGTNIKLLGYVDDKKAFGLIKGSKLFIFPSHEEGFGMAVGEALACDVPVVAYDLPVFKNTFKKLMYTSPCFNRKIFSEKIIEILETKKKLSTHKKDLGKFSWEQIVSLEKILLNI